MFPHGKTRLLVDYKLAYECKGTSTITWKTAEGEITAQELIQMKTDLKKLTDEVTELKKKLSHCALRDCREPACAHYNYKRYGSTWGSGYQ